VALRRPDLILHFCKPNPYTGSGTVLRAATLGRMFADSRESLASDPQYHGNDWLTPPLAGSRLMLV
jgi:hypothetical protein